MLVLACCEQQQKISSWEVLVLRGMDAHSPAPFFCVALDSPLQVTQQYCVILWISQLFKGSFLQGLKAALVSSDLVMVHDQVNSWSHGSVFPCVLLMCCADWNNTVCVQANPQSPAVLLQHFQGGNTSLALSECTFPCLSWDPPAVYLFHSGFSVLLFPQSLIPSLLSQSPDQLPALMEGLPLPFLWKASGNSKSCPRPEQWNFLVSKSLWPECCSKCVQCLLLLFRMRELQSNIKKAARALNYLAMEHCHSSIKLLWPVVFYRVHCS